MLAPLRKRVIGVLADARHVTLITDGPAGIQVSQCACQAERLCLHLWMPATSEHLVNLETPAEVLVAGAGWRMRGIASSFSGTGNESLATAHSAWQRLIVVRPLRVELLHADGATVAETIDIASTWFLFKEGESP